MISSNVELFVYSQGSIWLHYKGVALSMQEAYGVILGDEVSMEQYHVFAHFTRLGYTLRRYAGPYVKILS